MWTFDLETEDWETYLAKSDIAPSPRSEFAHARNGEILIIFGGNTDSGLVGDMHILELRDKLWKNVEIKSTDKPSARKGACMAVEKGNIYIFGGITDSGYSNELWMFDSGSYTYNLIVPNGKMPPLSARGNCKSYTDSNNQLIFEVFMGESQNRKSISSVYRYNTQKNLWSEVMGYDDYKPFSRSQTSAIYLNNKLLIAGGSRDNFHAHNEVFIVDTDSPDNNFYQVLELPEHSYNAASVFYKNKLYIHGGAANFGSLPLPNIPKNNLTVIQLDDDCRESKGLCKSTCSKGSYFIDDQCLACPEGSYSDLLESQQCTLCEVGNYSEKKERIQISFVNLVRMDISTCNRGN